MNPYSQYSRSFHEIMQKRYPGREFSATGAFLYDVKEEMDGIYQDLIKDMEANKDDRDAFEDVLFDLIFRIKHIQGHCEDALAELESIDFL